jgi:hypothetical protein
MPQTNHMTNYQFTIALMVFIVAYCVFETPSNMMMKILHPNRYVKLSSQWKDNFVIDSCRRWLGILVCAFGSFCCGIAGTHNFAGVTALRFFLGAAEA